MIKICILVACFVFLFVVAFRGATSAKFNSTLCPRRRCDCSLYGISLQVNCWTSWYNVDSKQLPEQLDSLLSSNLTYVGNLWIEYTSLTHVPRSVCRLTTLTFLSLDNNQLIRLPDNCLTNFTALTSFDASRNNITQLQDGLFDGPHTLERLDLSHNDILSIGSRTFGRLSNLKTLILSFNDITELQNGLFDELRTLETLDLSHNKISSIRSRAFDILSNLKTLILIRNGITELQNGLFDGLHTLETLDLRRNEISSIGSRVFNRLSNLNTLDLSYNGIIELQNGLFDGLHTLETLDLSRNEISSIGSRVFNRLSNLNTLDLSYNGIIELQYGLFDGPHKLRILYLTSNEISSIGFHVFDKLSNLEKIQLSYNDITQLQDGLFDGLHKLQELDVSHNNISSIGLRLFESSAMLNSLKNVDLSDNRIQTLEPWPILMGMNSTATIDLSNNNISVFTNNMGWKENCGMTKVPNNLLLDHQPIWKIADLLNGWNISLSTTVCVSDSPGGNWLHLLSYVVTLKCTYLDCNCIEFIRFNLELYVSTTDGSTQVISVGSKTQNDRVSLDQFVCELTEHCPSGCSCVHRTANATLHIYCSNANQTSLPLELPTPKSHPRYILDFSNNRHLRRLGDRDYFVNTSILDVSNSGIEQVESADVWKAILKIPQLNLYGNKLTSLPQSAVSLNVTTVSLNIAKNPWDCSCHNKWMPGWLNASRGRLTQIQNVFCYSPPRLHGRNIIQTSEEELCVDPVIKAATEAADAASKKAWTIGLSIAACVVVLLSVVAIFYRLRVKLYTRWKVHPFDRDECPGEDMDYNVFLCFSSLDDQPTGRRILELVEANGYRVCYHQIDFLPGLIVDNIEASVTRSKRTVCLITTNFIQRSANVVLVIGII